MFIRRHWWAIVYSLFLAAFTVYLAMDTFVIYGGDRNRKRKREHCRSRYGTEQ